MTDVLVMYLSWALVPVGILRYQVQGHRAFLGINAIVGALVAITYFYEGGFAGAAMSMASTSALVLQFAVGHRISLGHRLAIAIPFIVFGMTFKEAGFSGWLPFTAFAIARLAEALQKDLALRIILMGCTSLWIIYGFALELPQIVIFETMGLISNAISIWRFHLSKNLKGAP